MAKGKSNPAFIWVGSVLLSLMFLMAGGLKLIGPQLNPDVRAQTADQFAKWGYPEWFLYFVGAVEVVAGLSLLVPRVAWLGAGVLVVLMAGAIYTHLRFDLPELIIPPGLLLIACATLCYLRWPRASS
jgi:uncharacterized membrane protein YphA (DoxX/SURF4 family)